MTDVDPGWMPGQAVAELRRKATEQDVLYRLVDVADLVPLLDRLEGAEARVAALEAAARAAVAASDRICHDISYQGVLCAIVPVREWRALAALLDGDA